MLRSIGKQSGKSVESVVKKKKNATISQRVVKKYSGASKSKQTSHSELGKFATARRSSHALSTHRPHYISMPYLCIACMRYGCDANRLPLSLGWLGSRVVSVLDSGAEGPGFKSQSRRCRCNSLRQTVHTHHASVHQAAKLVAALLRVAMVTAGLAESSGSRVYDSRHLQTDCQEPGSAPEPYAR